jgi:hypothetical protein
MTGSPYAENAIGGWGGVRTGDWQLGDWPSLVVEFEIGGQEEYSIGADEFVRAGFRECAGARRNEWA